MEIEKKQMDIELRSEEFQEIVEQSPRWLIRSGISLILGFVILLLVGSYFFKYPDIVEARIIVVDQNQISGRIILSPKDARKVAIGQKVNIEIDEYSYPEYGYLEGIVRAITANPNDLGSVIEVEIPQNMVTESKIPFKLNLEFKGSAKIITKDLRLIQRFINPLKSSLKH